MAPQWYEVDVYAGTRHLTDQTQRVLIDWDPAHAADVRAHLNDLISNICLLNRAVEDDVRRYQLRAFPVDREGQRTSLYAWAYRYMPAPGDEQGKRR